MKTKSKSEYKDCFPYLLHLLSCVLKGHNPDAPMNNMDWTSLLKLSEFHSVAGMVSYAIDMLPADKRPEDSIYNIFRQYQAFSMVTESNVSIETEIILNTLSDCAVRVLPVKGYILKNDYPIPSMRSMTDVDIIFDAEKKQQVKEIFAQRGYTLSESGGELDFTKDDLFHYELHPCDSNRKATSHTYFSNILNLAEYEGYSLIGRLKNEDAYLYTLLHLSKHMLAGGAGIRMIMDIYVFNQAHRASFDKAYLDSELQKLKLADFEEKIRTLANSWFSSSSPDTDSILADFILCACTFGVSKDSILQSAIIKENKTGKKTTPIRAILHKVFPSYDLISGLYPLAEKHMFMYPFCVVAYWCNRIFKKRNINTDSIKHYVASTDSEDAERLRIVIEQAGLTSFL